MKALILDGYVDEPSCLGVPPFVSPYPRFVSGVLKAAKIPALYTTIDNFRENRNLREKTKSFDYLFIIAGIAVPGNYIGGKPLSKKEIFGLNLAKKNVLMGPMFLELSKEDFYRLEDASIEAIEFPFERKFCELFGLEFDLDKFLIAGADVVKQHPDFPNIICEIETYRGCYWGKCSFCIERFQRLQIRDPENVVAEIRALYDAGVRHFRIGKQTDFFTYLADFDYEFPKPNPEALKQFHRAIWEKCPKIKTLHLDNVNPKTIAEYPEESKEIIKTIAIYQTPGNVAAFGLESADEVVIRKNTLCATAEEVMFAVELMNRFGRAVGYNGLPILLPGLNFVIGLKGETRETFERNFEFLKELLDRDLLLRRINIRQVKIFPGTPMEKEGYRRLLKHKRYFNAFKKRVREEIDNPMLRRILPKYRKLTDLRVEIEGKISFARQIATYPILVGLVGEYKKGTFLDARVVDYGYRSVTAVESPLNVNEAKAEQLKALIGSKAAEIIKKRPFKDIDEVEQIADDAKLLFFVK
ncbi:MAG: radical SAM protein [Archaeoglobi archaeon]|jgi:radical SAM superfamily enzyme with C-terminal helix-hairpin-helix motif|nr:MAG: radical SAM protein [Archaeoglobi archaeon]TDA29550.1 MAG: radical SAM protein [Archaeoglobi archaeon]